MNGHRGMQHSGREIMQTYHEWSQGYAALWSGHHAHWLGYESLSSKELGALFLHECQPSLLICVTRLYYGNTISSRV